MVVYIRHGDDNNKHTKHKHDPHITKQGIDNVRNITKELIRKYGCPNTIYVSPFRRCIDTMKVMLHEINSTNEINKKKKNKVRLVCDVNLSRYFTKSDKKHPKVSKKTLDFGIPIYESKKDFHKRINYHVTETAKKHHENVVWCITHALVYKNIAKNLNITTNNRIEFLEYFSYTYNESESESEQKRKHKHKKIDRNKNQEQDDGPVPTDQLLPEQLNPEDPDYVPMTKRFAITKNIGKPL